MRFSWRRTLLLVVLMLLTWAVWYGWSLGKAPWQG
jgi:hypothetical protein